MFRAIDPNSRERTRANPRRLLTEIGRRQIEQADRDAELTARIERLASELRNDRHRPWREGPISPQHPVPFCCAEFGVHGSLPIYSGGLGILAGDILKEASDLALPMVGVGLM
jgi:starch phosphorylase